MPVLIIVLAAFLAVAFPGKADAASSPVKLYARAEGLPGTSVNCLFQDHDGLLWAGTDGGAASFDGTRWRAFTSREGLAGNEVYSIAEDDSGDLWFGTSAGFSRYNGTSWDRLGSLDGVSTAGRTAAVRDSEGRLWFGSPSGLVELDLEANRLARRSEIPFRDITSLFLDRDGKLWLTAAGGAARLDGGRWREWLAKDGLPAEPLRAGIADSRGIVWLASEGGLVEISGAAVTVHRRDRTGLPSDRLLSLAEDFRGRLWVGTDRGVAFFDGYRWRQPEGAEAWPDVAAQALLVDRGGNLWVGTRAGVVAIDLSWEAPSEETSTLGASHPVTRTPEGTLWFAVRGGAASLNKRLLDVWGERDGLAGVPRTLATTPDGELWLGTDQGAFRFDGRRFEQVSALPAAHRVEDRGGGLWVDVTVREPNVSRGLTGDAVNAILPGAGGLLWFATDEGLSALDGQRWLLFPDQPALRGPVRALAGAETVWAGTDAGLWSFDGHAWSDAGVNGGPSGRVTALLLEDDGRLWAGTDAGLWERLPDGWRRWRQEQGLLSEKITALVRDGAERLWIGTAEGLAIFDGLNWSSVTVREGLPAQEVRSLAVEPDGTLLVAGENYLVRYRPDAVPPRTTLRNPPTATVGTPQYLFEYQGADLLSEPYELRYSYRLDNGPWSPFSREPLVTVSDLANGSHTFEVRSMDRALNVDPSPARAVFEVNTALFDVEVRDLVLNNLHAALYRYYAGEFGPRESPVGRLVLVNRYDRPLKVKVGFYLPRFMDFATDRVLTLEPGRETVVPLRLELSEAVLHRRENSVEQLLVSLQYHIQGELKEHKFSRGVTIYGRNAMTWDDPRRICLFISHLDPELMALGRAALARTKRLEDDLVLDNNFIRAVVLFRLLGVAGLRYLPDPDHPFTGLSGEKATLDFIRFPRETLAQRAGDCDDLAVLYAALLQGVGIDTALVDVRDHVFLLVDTGLRGDAYRLLTPDPRRVFIDDDKRVWIPVETTLVDRPFAEAWERGIAEMNRPRTIISVPRSWDTYQPVLGGIEVTLPVLDGELGQLAGVAAVDLQRAEDLLLGKPVSALRAVLAADPRNVHALNGLGIVLGRHGYLRLAQHCFEAVVRLAPDFAGGHSNLANVAYERGDFPRAIELYLRALEIDPANGQVHVEIALTHAEMGNFEAARAHYLEAVKLTDPCAVPEP